MAPEDLDKMGAGREMDAEVHKALWPRHNTQSFENLDLLLWHYCDGDHEKSDSCQWQMVPNYSTEIAAAWLVVEKMAANGFDVTVSTCNDGEGYHCRIATDSGTPSFWREIADEVEVTAPLAICRAALKAHLAAQEPEGAGK